jgi:hypothetical protein
VGKNNRQRRADQRRQRSRHDRPQQGPRTDFSARDLAEYVIFEAAEAAERGYGADVDISIDALVNFVDDPQRDAIAAAAMTTCLTNTLRSAWEGGWQPADVVRAATKRLGRRWTDLAARVIAAEARMSAAPSIDVPPDWAEQLRHLPPGNSAELVWADPQALRDGVALLGMLMHLPRLPLLLTPPSGWGRSQGAGRASAADRFPHTGRAATGQTDSKMLAKVRALLAKAESTDFEDEADALTAKAQELMARHAIDQAMVTGANTGETPCGRRIGIDDPYALGKVNLLGAVAKANRCHSVWMEHYGFSTVFGFSSDLDIVDLLYTSLLVQATRAMTAVGSVRDGTGRSRTRSFRQSFLIAFSGRIGERLQAATAVATQEADVAHGGTLLPVLAGRNAAVDDAFEAAFPHLRQTSMRVSNHAGWLAGRAAADLANLGPDQQLSSGIAV